MIRFVITSGNKKSTLPDLNKYVDTCRSNAIAGGNMKKKAQELCVWQINQQCKGQHIDSCDVNIWWFEPNKRKDPDNIAFAKKFIFDALVQCGVLDNDGWKQINSLTDNFAVDKDSPRIEVELYERNS